MILHVVLQMLVLSGYELVLAIGTLNHRQLQVDLKV